MLTFYLNHFPSRCRGPRRLREAAAGGAGQRDEAQGGGPPQDHGGAQGQEGGAETGQGHAPGLRSLVQHSLVSERGQGG